MKNVFFKNIFFCVVLANSLIVLGAEENWHQDWQIVQFISNDENQNRDNDAIVTSEFQQYQKSMRDKITTDQSNAPLYRTLTIRIPNYNNIMTNSLKIISEEINKKSIVFTDFNDNIDAHNAHRAQKVLLQHCIERGRFSNFETILGSVRIDDLGQVVSLIKEFDKYVMFTHQSFGTDINTHKQLMIRFRDIIAETQNAYIEKSIGIQMVFFLTLLESINAHSAGSNSSTVYLEQPTVPCPSMIPLSQLIRQGQSKGEYEHQQDEDKYEDQNTENLIGSRDEKSSGCIGECCTIL